MSQAQAGHAAVAAAQLHHQQQQARNNDNRTPVSQAQQTMQFQPNVSRYTGNPQMPISTVGGSQQPGNMNMTMTGVMNIHGFNHQAAAAAAAATAALNSSHPSTNRMHTQSPRTILPNGVAPAGTQTGIGGQMQIQANMNQRLAGQQVSPQQQAQHQRMAAQQQQQVQPGSQPLPLSQQQQQQQQQAAQQHLQQMGMHMGMAATPGAAPGHPNSNMNFALNTQNHTQQTLAALQHMRANPNFAAMQALHQQAAAQSQGVAQSPNFTLGQVGAGFMPNWRAGRPHPNSQPPQQSHPSPAGGAGRSARW
jgi:hypothetical protein